MLFDLRGRGRRRTVQALYACLAILMGVTFVGFGIGSDVSGGLVDAFLGDGSSSTSPSSAIDKRIDGALAKTKANPKDSQAWALLAQLRFQRAGIDGLAADGITYTAGGKAKLRLASQAWERHLALDPKQPDVRTAKFMVQAYDKPGLNQLSKAVRAKEIVTAAEKPPNSNLYAQLALLSYQAGETRQGDLAADRAVELAEKSERKSLRDQLKALKAQVAAEQAQPQAGAGQPQAGGTGR